MGAILLLISIFLKRLIGKVAWVYTSLLLLFKGNYKEWADWNKQLAIANDRYGNVLLKYASNMYVIEKDGYKFGNGKETISSVIGKNLVLNKLKKTGKIINSILNYLDSNHSIESIDNNV